MKTFENYPHKQGYNSTLPLISSLLTATSLVGVGVQFAVGSGAGGSQPQHKYAQNYAQNMRNPKKGRVTNKQKPKIALDVVHRQ